MSWLEHLIAWALRLPGPVSIGELLPSPPTGLDPPRRRSVDRQPWVDTLPTAPAPLPPMPVRQGPAREYKVDDTAPGLLDETAARWANRRTDVNPRPPTPKA